MHAEDRREEHEGRPADYSSRPARNRSRERGLAAAGEFDLPLRSGLFAGAATEETSFPAILHSPLMGPLPEAATRRINFRHVISNSSDLTSIHRLSILFLFTRGGGAEPAPVAPFTGLLCPPPSRPARALPVTPGICWRLTCIRPAWKLAIGGIESIGPIAIWAKRAAPPTPAPRCAKARHLQLPPTPLISTPAVYNFPMNLRMQRSSTLWWYESAVYSDRGARIH